MVIDIKVFYLRLKTHPRNVCSSSKYNFVLHLIIDKVSKLLVCPQVTFRWRITVDLKFFSYTAIALLFVRSCLLDLKTGVVQSHEECQ